MEGVGNLFFLALRGKGGLHFSSTLMLGASSQNAMQKPFYRSDHAVKEIFGLIKFDSSTNTIRAAMAK